MTPELWKVFLKQTKKDEKTGCVLWTGPGYGEDGFGLDKATKQLAHRAAYVHYKGKRIQKGFIVAQSCERKRCCAEEHLSEEYVGRV